LGFEMRNLAKVQILSAFAIASFSIASYLNENSIGAVACWPPSRLSSKLISGNPKPTF
jgi:hypothetical protein